jgi:hypothetical protein
MTRGRERLTPHGRSFVNLMFLVHSESETIFPTQSCSPDSRSTKEMGRNRDAARQPCRCSWRPTLKDSQIKPFRASST